MIPCISERKKLGRNEATALKEFSNIFWGRKCDGCWMSCSHEFSACPIEPDLGKKRKAFDGGNSLRWGEEPALHLASAMAALSMPLPFFTNEVKGSSALETLMLARQLIRPGIMPPLAPSETCGAWRNSPPSGYM
ncbi:unnamed protein product [Urochloa decumbens]|uniref:Uncharacterized protein n=1 Tax=Urochloa decumbens TaxID=240449 RepID=A0ABC9AEH0_9POAL